MQPKKTPHPHPQNIPNKPPHTPTRPAGQRRHRTPTARATPGPRPQASAAHGPGPRPGPRPHEQRNVTKMWHVSGRFSEHATKCDENVTCLGKCETHTWTKMKIIWNKCEKTCEKYETNMKSYEIGPATYFLQKRLVKLTKIGRERPGDLFSSKTPRKVSQNRSREAGRPIFFKNAS